MSDSTAVAQEDLAPIKWYRTPIDRDRMRELTRRSNARGLLHMGALLGLAGFLGAVAYWSWYHWPWYVTVIAVYVYGQVFGFVGEGTVGHELSHGTPFRSRWLNETFLVLTAFLTWSNYQRFRYSHREHHKFTTHYPQELEVVLPKGFRAVDWLFLFIPNPLRIATDLYGHFRRALGIVSGQWEKRLFPEGTARRRALILWSRILVAGHILLAGLFVWLELWPLLVLITGGVYLGSWLVPACTMPQHVGLQPNVADFRLCTRTMHLGPLMRFLYWNMNYHIEHHMYASVPAYRLRELHEEIRHDLPPVKKGLWANWRELLYAMRRQKHDMDWYIPVEAPNAPQAGAGDKQQ
jgi:fatty acid desaturase